MGVFQQRGMASHTNSMKTETICGWISWQVRVCVSHVCACVAKHVLDSPTPPWVDFMAGCRQCDMCVRLIDVPNCQC